MSKENPWFKFEPAEWMFGRIQRQTPEVKVLFIDLICKYWHRECNMTLEDAVLDFGEEEIQLLIKNKIVCEDEGYLYISFLDVQMESIERISKKNSENGIKSAEARKKKALLQQGDNDPSTTAQPNPTEKIREEEIRKDKIIKKERKKEVFVLRKALIQYGFNEQEVEDWLKVRRTKRLASTETAYNGFIKEIEKASKEHSTPINGIFTMMVEKSWGGLNSSWLAKELPGAKSSIPQEPDMGWYNDYKTTQDQHMEARKKWKLAGWESIRTTTSVGVKETWKLNKQVEV